MNNTKRFHIGHELKALRRRNYFKFLMSYAKRREEHEDVYKEKTKETASLQYQVS